MSAALDDLVRKGRTSDPVVQAYFRAQQINQAAGGAVVKPWEVQQLDEEWLVAAEMLTVQLPQRRKQRTMDEQLFQSWRSKHPAYRNRRRI